MTTTKRAYESATGRRGLLDVLDLLPDPLKLLFDLHDLLDDGHVRRLGADRVDLPIHLLQEKVELSPGGDLGPDELQEVIAVGFEPHALLGQVEPLRENRGLLRQALFGKLPFGEELADPLPEALLHLADPRGRPLADLGHAPANRAHPRLEVAAEDLPLDLLHSNHVVG